MTTKQYLQRVFRAKERILSNQEKILVLRDFTLKVSSHTDSVRVDGSSSCGNRAIASDRIIDLEASVNRDTVLFNAVYTEIQAVIDAVQDPVCHKLLTLRYLCFRSWEEIAERMGYSSDHVRGYLHRQALQKVNTT